MYAPLIRQCRLLLSLFAASHIASAATLTHHWKLDEGAGSAVADSVGGATMSISGSNSGWTTGQVDGTFLFDGSNYAVTNSVNTVANPSGSVAITGWFYTGVGVDRRDVIYDVEDVYTMRINNGRLQVTFNDNLGSAPRWGDQLEDGLWHHFAAQYDGGQTSLYIDGVLAGSRTETLGNLNSTSQNFTIGARRNGSNPFEGAVDDVRYYLGALTLSEIQALAQISSLPPTAYDDNYTASVNAALNVAAPGVLANDSEPDGDAVTALLQNDVAVGSLTLNSNGSFSYAPPADFSGVVTFTYFAVDDAEGSSGDPATVTLTVLDASTSLTPEEITQIETDLGITLSSQEILDLASIVKPQSLPAWRSGANLRIETQRKADLTVEIVDSNGTPVPGATVHAALQKNAFKFGGVVTVMDLTDASGDLSAAGSTTNDWKQIVTALFNSVGLNNGFKPKITGQHTYIPGFMSWATANDLDVRGHLLMWPGGGDLEDLDSATAISGDDYGNHLSTASTSAYASYDVLGAVNAYKTSTRTQTDKDALESIVDAEITEWVSQWDVYEWDVVNETIGNILLQEILGYDQMAEWFKIAEANKVSANTGLFINDFQVISGQFEDGSTQYATRRDTYFDRIDRVIADGGPITGIGFQSRFKYGHIPPETVYSRLEEFATRYPGLDLSGTEFEMKDRYNVDTGALIFEYDEYTRAQMTEEILTTYYSHDQVVGLHVWDFINPETDPADPTTSRALCYYDGTVKLNGLVWYYLHRIRYHTDSSDSTGPSGAVTIPGYKGDYALTVSYGGKDYAATHTLLANGTVQIVLNDVTLAPTERLLEHWLFDDAANTELESTLNSTGTADFTGGTPAVKTDGSGALVIAQHSSITVQFDGDFILADSLLFGARDTGRYELEFQIDAASLTTGDPNGATVGFGLRDSSLDKDVFLLRLNKTVGGLAVSTFIDATYTQVDYFSGVFALGEPLRLRAVIDLDADTADIYLKSGNAAEAFAQQVALSTTAQTIDQILFATQNNQTDWGVSDTARIDYCLFRKLDLESYSLWSAGIDWGGETLQAESDNPDFDALTNFMEYALGGNPVVADGFTQLPRTVQVSGEPHIEFTLGADSVALDYWLEHSADLSDWNTLPETRVQGQAGDLIQIPLLDSNLNKRFSRLTVNLPQL